MHWPEMLWTGGTGEFSSPGSFKILMNAAIVNGLKSLSGAGGWLGTVGGWISGQWQTQGGVYTSANLSAYSNTIVDTPTYFAFAKGPG